MEQGEKRNIVSAALLPGWIRNFENALSDSIWAHHMKWLRFKYRADKLKLR